MENNTNKKTTNNDAAEIEENKALKPVMATRTVKFELEPQLVIGNKKYFKRVIEDFTFKINKQLSYISNYQKWIPNVEEKIKFEKNRIVINEEDVEKQKKTLAGYEKKISEYNKKIDKAKDMIEKLQKTMSHFEDIYFKPELSKMEMQELTNIAKNYTYSIIRRACSSEAIKKNATLSYVYSECISRGVHNIEDDKEKRAAIIEIFNYCNRVQSKGTNVNNSLYDIMDLDNPLGGYGFGYNNVLSSRLLKMISKGVFEGKISLDTFKENSPVTVVKKLCHLMPNFDLKADDDFEDFRRKIQKENGKVSLILGSSTKNPVVSFTIRFGSKTGEKNRNYAFIMNVVSQNYTLCGSSIQIENKGKHDKIFINLTCKKEITPKTLNENKTLGVDVGINHPAYCAINCTPQRFEIGNKSEFLRIRTQLEAQQQRYDNPKYLSSKGIERKKLYKASRKLTKRKAYWKKTFNHMLAVKIVNTAIKEDCKYINLENLSSKKDDNKTKVTDTNFRLLNDWSYYQLQQFIEYKAKEKGITVRYISANNTSITCRHCGNVDKEQRNGVIFKCSNPECTHYNKEVSADYNAAKNIANATLFKKIIE